MLGGGRALLLQAAHPLVAAGIVDHSRYRDDPWRRLARTMTALYTIVFGSRADAARVGELTRSAHMHVRGRRGGVPYAASDPELMLWVHSTLVDNGLLMYETYVAPLAQPDRDEFYAQMKTVGTVFGVAPELHPPTLADLRAYQRRLIETGQVRVGDDARAVAQSILHPPVPAALRPGLREVALATATLLPDELRRQYGLEIGRARRAIHAASARSARAVVPFLPPAIRATERLPLRALAALARR